MYWVYSTLQIIRDHQTWNLLKISDYFFPFHYFALFIWSYHEAPPVVMPDQVQLSRADYQKVFWLQTVLLTFTYFEKSIKSNNVTKCNQYSDKYFWIVAAYLRTRKKTTCLLCENYRNSLRKNWNLWLFNATSCFWLKRITF